MPDLLPIARDIRALIITMIATAGSGHPAGSLGLADIFAFLYFSGLFHLDPEHPHDPHRDRIIVSNGHVCPAWYAALALRGYFPQSELTTLRQFGSRLQGHPHKDFSLSTKDQGPITNLPGIENTAGPLGQGISFAAGLALGLNQQSNSARVICLTGDGELDEGQAWEAFMFAAKYHLHNLTYIVDRNDIQIDGPTHQVMSLEPLADKLASFGLRVVNLDGHNPASLAAAFTHPSSQPTVILARTVPGKGVPFMENDFQWHGRAPTSDQAKEALRSIRV